MMEYVRILSGAKTASMALYEWRSLVELRNAESSPGEGWWPVEKVLPKPTLGEGEELAWTYTVRDGVAYKEYFIAPAGKSFLPRTFSKLRLYAAISAIGKWDALRTWLESQTVNGMNAWTAFSLAQDLSEDNELFDRWFSAAKTALGVDDATAEAVLAASVKGAD